MHLYPVWVSSNFDPLLPNSHPLFTENIQYSQGFTVIHPMNMHFYASIYDFRWPNYPRSFHVTLSCIVLYRYSCKSAHHKTILHYGVLCVLLPRGSIVGQKFCVFIDYRRLSTPIHSGCHLCIHGLQWRKAQLEVPEWSRLRESPIWSRS